MELNGSEFTSCLGNESAATFKLSTLGYIVTEILLSVFITFGNTLVLVAITKFGELRTSMNVYVISLALADLSIALITLPFHIAIYAYPVLKSVFIVCMVRYSILIFSTGTSSITLTLISLDRYFAIERPFDYNRIMTTARAKWLSLCVWVLTFTFGSLPLFGWHNWSACASCVSTMVLPYSYLILVFVIIASNILFICVLNVKIGLTANKVADDIQIGTISDTRRASSKQRTRKSLIKNKKALKALFVMTGAFTMCFLPFGIYLLWEINCVDRNSRSKYDAPRVATAFLSLVNSGLNPVIYHWRIPEFNSAFRRLLCIKPKTPQTIKSTSTSVVSRSVP